MTGPAFAVPMLDIVGYAAGVLIAISFLPQVIRSWRTRRVRDLSLAMILTTLAGTVLWILYGALSRSSPIIVMNTVFGLMVIILLVLKIRHD